MKYENLSFYLDSFIITLLSLFTVGEFISQIVLWFSINLIVDGFPYPICGEWTEEIEKCPYDVIYRLNGSGVNAIIKVEIASEISILPGHLGQILLF